MKDPFKKSELPDGEVYELTDLVNYAEGAIVSRTLRKTAGGTVTLFAFDAGQELSEHTAPFDALVHVLDGEGQFVIAGQSHTVKTGQLIVMPADVPHAVSASQRFKMLLTMLKNN